MADFEEYVINTINSEDPSNYPPADMGLDSFRKYLKYKFIEICNTILYSDDMREVTRCYDMLFTTYRREILAGSDIIRVSCFEDVILKMLNDDEDNLMALHGVKYTAFQRFIALLAERDKASKHNSFHKKNPNEYKINLKAYLLMFIDGKYSPIKNDFIRNLIHKHFTAL